MNKHASPSTFSNGLLTFMLITLIAAVNVFMSGVEMPSYRLTSFIVSSVAFIAILACIGRQINLRPAGVLIDNRNRVSLSKLQATAWTILILSGLTVAASIRLWNGTAPSALAVGIPTDLLIVMGISATSLVATPTLLNLKAQNSATEVFQKQDAASASWADIFRGDDVSNSDSPDLGKIQQVFITGLLLAFYAIQLGKWLYFWKPEQVGSMPEFGDQMTWLLGISHAGYLGYKAAPHGGSGGSGASDQPEVG